MVAPDPFQPPEADRNELLELADVPTRRVSIAPQPSSDAQPAAPGPALKRAVSLWGAASPRRFPPLVRLREALAESSRARFAAGVMLAFLVGLVPAQIYAWSRARTAYDDIRADLRAEYRAADTPEKWATLQTARDDAADLARSRRQRLAVSSSLLWLAVGGAVAFAWFRVIDWPGSRPRPSGPGADQPGSPPEAARAAASRFRPMR